MDYVSIMLRVQSKYLVVFLVFVCITCVLVLYNEVLVNNTDLFFRVLFDYYRSSVKTIAFIFPYNLRAVCRGTD